MRSRLSSVATSAVLTSSPTLGGIALWLLAAQTAHAQTPPPSQTPAGEQAGSARAVPAAPVDSRQTVSAPAGSETITFVVSSVDVEDDFAGIASRTDQLPKTGSTLTVADIYQLAARLQGEYADAGFPLVRVVVPPQEIGAASGGWVRLRVISGHVERVDVSNVPARVRDRVASIVGRLMVSSTPTREELERALLVASDISGLSLKSTLTPGNAVGGVILVLNGEFRGMEGVVSVDNSLGADMGRYQATGSLAFNSTLAAGDAMVVTLAGPADETLFRGDRTREFASASYQAPIGTDGLLASVDVLHASSQPRGSVAAQKLESTYSRLALGVSAPLVRLRSVNHSVHASLELAEERQETAVLGPPVTLSLDKVTALRVGLSGNARGADGSMLAYDVQISQGLDVLGARSASEASPLKPLSRAGADSEFTSFALGGSLSAPLSSGFNLMANTRYTTGFGSALLRSEQSSIVAANLVSGPPPGSLTGDETLAGRIEIDRPIPLQLSTVAPYAFVAAGMARLEQPTVLESREETLTAAGVGMRALLPLGPQTTLVGRIEWSRINADRSDLGKSWVTGSVALRF